MSWLRLYLRFVYIALLFGLALVTYAFRRVRLGFGVAPERVELLRGETLAALFAKLGATFVKLGQILSTRPDLLPPGYITPLARLQDDVPPLRFEVIETVLAAELTPEKRARIVSIEPEPIAAASVAQVHRGKLDTGETVALKIQRPEAETQIRRDLSIASFWARVLNLVPSISMLSLPGSVEHFGEALSGQLDFREEAAHNRRFARNFSTVDKVRVPTLFDDLCTRRVLVMEFVSGVKATEPEKVGGNRAVLARLGGECVLKMVFTDGFVHADLHPGNIILTPDDHMVLIDLGMVTEIPPDMLRPWLETFVALSQMKGQDCARLFYSHAPTVAAATNYVAFEADVVRFLDGLYGKKLGEVEVSVAVSGMMNVLRKHRVQIDPCFTVVNIALLVAEGLGKQLDPSIDLVPLATPYLADAMLSAPPGRAPLRAVPS